MPLHLVPRGLLYIEAVAEHGSIQAASRAIGISASAIDRQIVQLEDRLGVRLFDRMTTGMALSIVGETFVVLARRWRADEDRIWSDVKQMQGVDLGHIRLATMDSLVNGPIPKFLTRIAEKYPRVRVDVEIATPDDAVQAIISRKADIALAFNLKPQRDVHVAWTENLPLVCVAAPFHPLVNPSPVTLRDVIDFPLVLQSRALAIRRILEARHAWILSENRPPVVTNSLQLLKQLVISGSHVALTSKLDVAQELQDGTLCALPIKEKQLTVQSISVAISSRRTLPNICRTVLDELVEEMGSLVKEISDER